MPRRCSACGHPELQRIDDAIRRPGAVYSNIGLEYGIDREAISRHAKAHVRPVLVKDPTPPPGPADQPIGDKPPRAPRKIRTARSKEPITARELAEAKEAFLEHFAANGHLAWAAAAAGVTRAVVRQWQEHDEQFSLHFNEASNDAVEALEGEARERAVRGKMIREVWRGDRMVERIVEWRPSDTLLVKLLQALKPEKYGDKLAITSTTTIKAIDAQAWDSV